MRKGLNSIIIVCCVIFSFNATFAKPLLKDPERAKKIAKKMIDRDDGRTSYNKSVLLSCEFKMSGTKRKCISKPRKKIIETISKDIGKGLKDSINLSLIMYPSSDKGVAFLQKDYDMENKDSEQWMYLPALKKLKRIVSESSNSPKTGALFGSEIAYEDLEKVHLSDYEYSLLGEDAVDGRKVYVLESYPTKKRKPKTSYSSVKLWIDQESYMVLKSESYNRRGLLAKSFFFKKLKKINGIWVSQMMIVVNHKNNRMSMMKIQNVSINLEIPDGLFKTRALKDSSFRESKMKTIRK